MCHFQPLWNLNFADLYGGVPLPVPALNLILSAGLVLQNFELRPAPLRDDLPGDFNFAGVLASEDFLLVGAHGDHILKGHLPSDLPFELLHTNRLPRLDAVLLPPTPYHGVHAASPSY